MYLQQRKKWSCLMKLIELLLIITLASCGKGTKRQNDQTPADEGIAHPLSPPERLVSESTGQQSTTASGIHTHRVTLTSYAASYRKGERIVATVANGLQHPIYTEDMKTDCSIVTLEYWDGTWWQPVLNCGMERLPAIAKIEAGQTVKVEIGTESSHFGASPTAQKRAPGVDKCRLKFTYWFTPGPEGFELEELEVMYSDAFAIYG